MEIIRETEDYAVLRKRSGEDSERDMPAGLLCVHRLDLTAGGLLVYGKHRAAAAKLSQALQSHALEKSYLIVVPGRPEAEEGHFEDLLFKDTKKQKMFPVKRLRNGVKPARLSYRVLETVSLGNAGSPQPETEARGEQSIEEKERPAGDSISLLRVWLDTGRFHQIRAQFAARKMPLLGDRKYGSRIKCAGIALFCASLRFPDPRNGEMVETESEPDATFPWNCFRREHFTELQNTRYD